MTAHDTLGDLAALAISDRVDFHITSHLGDLGWHYTVRVSPHGDATRSIVVVAGTVEEALRRAVRTIEHYRGADGIEWSRERVAS